jgi:hypothetical protein
MRTTPETGRPWSVLTKESVKLAHLLATKAITAGRVKNDSVDARTLAHLVRTHLLPEGWIAPPRSASVAGHLTSADCLG